MQREASMFGLGASEIAVAVRLAQRPHGEVGQTVISDVDERTPTELCP